MVVVRGKWQRSIEAEKLAGLELEQVRVAKGSI
jgi:hypothetical protein